MSLEIVSKVTKLPTTQLTPGLHPRYVISGVRHGVSNI